MTSDECETGECLRPTGRVLHGTGEYQRVRRIGQVVEMTRGWYSGIPTENLNRTENRGVAWFISRKVIRLSN
jgi:hypothetical protein